MNHFSWITVALLYFCSLTNVSPLVDSYSFYNNVYFPIFPILGMFIKHLKGSFVFHFDYVTWLAFWPSLLRSRREYSLCAASMQINSFPLVKITIYSHSKLFPAKIKKSGMLQSYLKHFAGGVHADVAGVVDRFHISTPEQFAQMLLSVCHNVTIKGSFIIAVL